MLCRFPFCSQINVLDFVICTIARRKRQLCHRLLSDIQSMPQTLPLPLPFLFNFTLARSLPFPPTTQRHSLVHSHGRDRYGSPCNAHWKHLFYRTCLSPGFIQVKAFLAALHSGICSADGITVMRGLLKHASALLGFHHRGQGSLR